MLIRRPGCCLCREAALELSTLQEALATVGFDLVGISKEEVGSQLFAQEYLRAPVFVDVHRLFFSALGCRQARAWEILGSIRVLNLIRLALIKG
jgi:hypothetical protein